MKQTLAVALFLIFAVLGGHALEVVPELDATAYVGRWYQVYTNYWADLFSNVMEPDCVTADYAQINATFLSVYNANYRFDEKYTDDISGYAYIPDLSTPGKLKVVLEGVPVEGDYWIFELGPKINGQYQYSLVTDGEKARQLFVLARNPSQFALLYEKQVLNSVANAGFRGPLKRPYAVPHPDECVYPPTASL
ncbi:outer membrane lipoprotein Blc-like [Diadema antillarum]|uniref:outer membrane lipoprotein Blc-like n=1 Tax=Diadema antillarum TaxID=105358 RepID=UPI003A8725B8